ncbi:MAG TPA: PspC domain-containing protein, partial [Egibacteraceae bacterium]|nr:PspC domain-containing protein [Egibacteraceae bacterium]
MNETSAPPADAIPPPDEPPPPQTGPPAARRLERHPTDKVLGGVAGGLGRYFGVDPIVFRLAFVGFALFGGGGILLYLIAWAAMPLGEGGEAGPARDGVDFAAWVGLG